MPVMVNARPVDDSTKNSKPADVYLTEFCVCFPLSILAVRIRHNAWNLCTEFEVSRTSSDLGL